MQYPVVIHKDTDSAYGVTVPDLPGCFSAGDTMDEAMSNVVEAIECHVEGLLLEGEDIPLPQPMDIYYDNPDYEEGIWGVVSVDLSKLSGKATWINITIPERILSKIDTQVAESGGNRSSYLVNAALAYIRNDLVPTKSER
ncbi:type II toxin-antitoxin system HicB family antitoxin [Acaryochloris sp. CCMEE 5410]|uniref:type II toxin-antitoxin system HicB family antitoxin n=1 Tax=Acaryochloris sp. CCMEE 5410 TaxID=310037 RepID=UPI0002484337|nr:type II toxin-antitoxin system HicB family antitoxin [Acaryochloris sp. CCMEE 5410]KAI9133106.1 type II toxin-antitoxin system HicB family antitoxin [Acaryochloris sp. CCMEE 5410]